MSHKKQFNIRLDESLIEWLKSHSGKQKRTVPAQLTYILEKEKDLVQTQSNHHSAD